MLPTTGAKIRIFLLHTCVFAEKLGAIGINYVHLHRKIINVQYPNK